MPFKQIFERKVNDNMRDPQTGPAPPEHDEDIKKMPPSRSSEDIELENIELHDKKDRPPRFSTLFGVTPPPPPQQEYYSPPRPARRSGVYVPTPLFVVFAIILFFESTILFAYTVIGLYNNAPSRLVPWAGPGYVSCGEQQQQQQPPPAVNFAPNFVMGGGQPAVTQVVPDAALLPTTIITSSTSTSTTTSSTTSTSASNAAAASDIAGILGGLTTSTSTEPPLTVTSLKLITSTAAPPPETVTATTWVDGPTATARR